MLEFIAAVIASVGNTILALLVLAKNAKKAVNIYFAATAFSLAIWAIVNYISINPIYLDQLTWIRIVMAIASPLCLSILLLADTFPDGKSHFKRRTKVIISLIGAIVSCLALSPWLFVDISYVNGNPQPQPGPAMPLFLLYIAPIFIAMTVILIKKFLRFKGVYKEYVRYALSGIVLTISSLVLTNLVFVIVFNNSSLVPISPLFSLFFTVSFAYGMARDRLFDIRIIVARLLAYVLFILAMGMIYGTIIALISSYFIGTKLSAAQIVASGAIAGVLILLAKPLKKLIDYLTRRIFCQDDYDTKDVLDRVTSLLVHLTHTDTLIKRFSKIVTESLKSEFIVVYIPDDNSSGSREISHGHRSPKFEEVVSDSLRKKVKDLVSVDIVSYEPSELESKMEASRVSIIVKLKTHNEIVGYCLIGNKNSGSPYTNRDINLIRIACDELAIAIQNAMRYEQIERFNETLQHKINEATKELRQSNRKLHALDEAKDEFISMASHQLRTPLTSVKGYLSMALEGDAGKLNKDQSRLLQEAYASSQRMVYMISDFLNISRLKTGKFIIEPVATDLPTVIKEEIDQLKPSAESRGLNIKTDIQSKFPTVYIDENKVRQVIMNFIDNAIFYSNSGGEIDIVLKEEDGDIIFTVQDYGIGIPDEEKDGVFTKFFRASNAKHLRPDGTGIGLFMAKKVIIAHGGHMIFSTKEHKGSTFGFKIEADLVLRNNSNKLKHKPHD